MHCAHDDARIKYNTVLRVISVGIEKDFIPFCSLRDKKDGPILDPIIARSRLCFSGLATHTYFVVQDIAGASHGIVKSMSKQFPPLHPKIVLGIAAHPDDLDVGAGGTIASFAAQGAEVHYLILTDGGKGSDDLSMTTAQLIETRHNEQKAALEIVGGKSITFLDYPDGELEITMELKRQIVKSIRAIKPDVVITMDPTVVYVAEHGIINHPDHRAAGQATLDAVFPLARDRLTFPELFAEGYLPHKTPTVLMVNFSSSNFTVDITETFNTKIEALKAHASQFGDVDGDGSTWLREMAHGQGQVAGYELGEGFIRLDIR